MLLNAVVMFDCVTADQLICLKLTPDTSKLNNEKGFFPLPSNPFVQFSFLNLLLSF